MDGDLLEAKIGTSGLVHGMDFFSNASDYITFVEAKLVLLAKSYDEHQLVDGGDGLLDLLEGTTAKMSKFLEMTRKRMKLVKKTWGKYLEAGQQKAMGSKHIK